MDEPDDRVEFLSSIASQRFKHDAEMPKSFATRAICRCRVNPDPLVPGGFQTTSQHPC